MSVDISKVGEVAVVFPSGDIHRPTGPAIEKAFNSALQSDASTIVISFRDASALLSEGIRLMITLRDSAAEANKNFAISDLSPEVEYTLKITNLLDFLGHVDSLEHFLEGKSLCLENLAPYNN